MKDDTEGYLNWDDISNQSSFETQWKGTSSSNSINLINGLTLMVWNFRKPKLFLCFCFQSCYKRVQLGLILNHELTFLSLSSTDWGSYCYTLRMLYKAIVHYKLDYGIPIYGSARPHILDTLIPVIMGVYAYVLEHTENPPWRACVLKLMSRH